MNISLNTQALNNSLENTPAQLHLQGGALRNAPAAAPFGGEDRVHLSAPLITDMDDSQVESLLASTAETIEKASANALAAHSGLNMSRALSLLDGLDLGELL